MVRDVQNMVARKIHWWHVPTMRRCSSVITLHAGRAMMHRRGKKEGVPMRRRHMLSAILMTSLAACASANTYEGVGAADEPVVQTGRTSDVISSAEMTAAGVTDAFQAISRLRPFFLRRAREMSAVTPNRS